MTTMTFNGKTFEVDDEIASIVHALNAAGISTVASCSGHGMRPGRISLADGRELFVLPSYEIGQWFETQFPRDINGQTKEERAADEPSAGVKCTHCNGKGYNEPIYDEQDGWIDETPCETCNGSGRITTVEQYLKTLPANWHEDSSLETWFPITAEELKRLKDERASQPPTVAHLPTRCADEHQEITFVGERCPLCEALGLLAKEKATTERLEKRVKDARELLVAWVNYDSEDVQFQRPPTDATKRFLGIAAVTKSATVPVLPTSEEDERIVDAAIKRRLSAETSAPRVGDPCPACKNARLSSRGGYIRCNNCGWHGPKDAP